MGCGGCCGGRCDDVDEVKQLIEEVETGGEAGEAHSS